MDTVDSLDSLKDLTTALAGQPFGTWQFWTIWGVGLLFLLLFGRIIANGVARSEKPFFGIFIGNLLVTASMLVAAWAVLSFATPHIDDALTVTILAYVAAGLDGIILCVLLGPALWANSRGASLLACAFALALGFGAMFTTGKVLEAVTQGRDSVEKQQAPLNDSLQESSH